MRLVYKVFRESEEVDIRAELVSFETTVSMLICSNLGIPYKACFAS